MTKATISPPTDQIVILALTSERETTMQKIAATSILKVSILLTFAVLTVSSFAQTFPTVVATVKVTGQTTPISQTVLFTPIADGMFRISGYMVTTVPKTNGTKADWAATMNWTDDAGNWLWQDVAVTFSYQRTNSTICCQPNAYPLMFWAKAGTPISYSVLSFNGQATGSTYEVFLTLEQLM